MVNSELIEKMFGALVREITKDLVTEEVDIFDRCDFGNYLSIWSSVETINESIKQFSIRKDAKILDIGSGIGKFCLIGAMLYPKIHFTGIEMSERRVLIANRLKHALRLDNVTFVHADFCDVYKDYTKYKYVYFFNPFDMGVHEKIKKEQINDEYDILNTFKEKLNTYLSSLSKGSKVYSNNPQQSYPKEFLIKINNYSEDKNVQLLIKK